MTAMETGRALRVSALAACASLACLVCADHGWMPTATFWDGDHADWAQQLPTGSEDSKCLGMVRSQYVPFWCFVAVITALLYSLSAVLEKVSSERKEAMRPARIMRSWARAIMRRSTSPDSDLESKLLDATATSAVLPPVETLISSSIMERACTELSATQGLEAACLSVLLVLKTRCTYASASVAAASATGKGRMIDVELELPRMSFKDLLRSVDRCLKEGREKGPDDTAEVTFVWGVDAPADAGSSQWVFKPQPGKIRVKAPSSQDEASFRLLFDELSQQPQNNVWDAAMMTATGEDQVRVWGAPKHNMAMYRSSEGKLLTFPQIFFEADWTSHEQIAIAGKGFNVSYASLRGRVAAVANAVIKALPGESSKPVVVYMGRGEAVASAFFGVLHAGHYIVPVDVHWPADRARSVVEQASAVLALVEASSEAAWQALALASRLPKSIRIDDECLLNAQKTKLQLDQNFDPEKPAIVLFTSGSTGKPKGIILSHGYVVTLAAGRAQSLQMNPKTRTLLHQSPTWMPFIDYLFGPMLSGGCCVFAPEQCQGKPMTPADLRAMAQEHAVTILGFVPPVLDIFLDEALPPELRCICVGGAAVPAQLCHRGIEAFRQHENIDRLGFIATGYHGTEQGDVTQIQLRSEDDIDAYASAKGFMTSGRPHTTQRVAVLDQAFNLVSPGGIGEISVAGSGLASGYLDMPEKTAETFFDCDALLGERTMRTSDLGRWTNCGSLEVVGRRDSMVKVRGARVELGEVECAISEHPDVRACVVLVHQDRLVAYVSPAVPSDLRDVCKSRLASYMVPHAFQGLEELPQLSNGKVNKKALPPPTEAEADGSETIMELDSLGQMRKLTRMSISEDRILDNVRAILMIVVIQSHATPLAPGGSLKMYQLEPMELHGDWSQLTYALLQISRMGGWSALAYFGGFDDTRGDGPYKLSYREGVFLLLWIVSGFNWTLWFLPAFVYMRICFVFAHTYNVMFLHMAILSQIWLTVPMFLDWYTGWKPSSPGTATACPAQCFCPFERSSWIESAAYDIIGMWTVPPNMVNHSFIGRALFFIPCYWLGFFTGRHLMQFLVKINDELSVKQRLLVALMSGFAYMCSLIIGQPVEAGFDDRCGSFWLGPWSLPIQLLKNIAFYFMMVFTSLLYVIVVVAVMPLHLKRLAKTCFAAYILASNTHFACLVDLPVMALELRKVVPPSIVPVAESIWVFSQPTLYVLTAGSLCMWLVQAMAMSATKLIRL
eukprot:TRINITY_DN9789_c0_g1_i4.p1 TRINITY_DN9789_c0_g1~~TRINITY_DN9789_c0_g1_i4.p1  ORF type:complete len:1238 (-),score=177.27 TRINITY_DN9789_c0_g1_i4:48-3761(-)